MFDKYRKQTTLFTPHLCSFLNINFENPTLADELTMTIIDGIYLPQTLNLFVKADKLLTNEACKYDTVIFSVYLSILSHISVAETFETHNKFCEEFALKIQKALFFLDKTDVENDLLTDRIDYYHEHTFNNNSKLDLDLLINSFSSILSSDILHNSLQKSNSPVAIIGFTEMVELTLQSNEFYIAVMKEINNCIGSFYGQKIIYQEEKPKQESKEMTVDEYKAKLKKENNSTVMNPYDGKYIFRATKDQGGFVYTRSRADGSMSKYYVKDKKTIKLKSVESIRLVNCELTDRKVSFSLFSDLTDLFHNAKALPVLLAVIVIVAIILIPVLSSNKNDDTLKTISSTTELRTARTTTESRYIEYPEPKSGAILQGREYFNESELTITASDTESCVVKLKNISGVTRLSFYVRAGDSVTVGVPAQKMYVYFASGKNWYGTEDLFGKFTSYSKDSTICNFEKYTMTYTLYPVSDGNFSETPIDADEF